MRNRSIFMYGMKNVTIDMCKYLRSGSGSNFMNFIISDLRKTSNMVHPCPYTVTWYIHNFRTCIKLHHFRVCAISKTGKLAAFGECFECQKANIWWNRHSIHLLGNARCVTYDLNCFSKFLSMELKMNECTVILWSQFFTHINEINMSFTEFWMLMNNIEIYYIYINKSIPINMFTIKWMRAFL